jgi:hypothetical protein
MSRHKLRFDAESANTNSAASSSSHVDGKAVNSEENVCPVENIVVEEDVNMEFDSFLYLRSLSALYLKLTSQYLLPNAVVDCIIHEMKNIHEMGQFCIKQNIARHLEQCNISDVQAATIINDAFEEDPYVQAHDSNGELRPHYKRLQFQKKTRHYYAHEKVSLGVINGTERHFSYVPIKNT